MEFFKKQTRFDFMGIRRYTAFFSILLAIWAVGLLATKGLNFGLDFTGGTQIEIRGDQPVPATMVKTYLEKAGFANPRVQQFGSTHDIIIRIGVDSEAGKVTQLVKEILQKQYPSIQVRRTEFVGSEVGQQLVERGIWAIVISVLATMIYVALRFEYRLAISAAVGVCHDALLILGVFSLFQFEFDLPTLASILAVLGYSLNDTIVVFDRVRENFRKLRSQPAIDILNLSINQTLSRTVMTSWMTLLVVLALLWFGGESLFGFSMAFFVGIVVATFSSIYVAGALALGLGLTRADLLPKPKLDHS